MLRGEASCRTLTVRATRHDGTLMWLECDAVDLLDDPAVGGVVISVCGACRHHADGVDGHAERVGRDLLDLRDEALPHLRPAVVHLHAAVAGSISTRAPAWL